MPEERELSSAGHRLGQMVGDWWERFLVSPLLEAVAKDLDLYLDSRFVSRTCRGDKIIWADADRNETDYDFVLELGGRADKLGIPVGFVETFWRRGSRHSKDKARDDTGKLVPMKETYPTARYLGIVACGDFTEPAKTLVRSRDVHLFYAPKNKVVSAFKQCGIEIDYPDNLPEAEKQKLASVAERKMSIERTKKSVARALLQLVGSSAINAFILEVRSALSAMPQEIAFTQLTHSEWVVFRHLKDASRFLDSPSFEVQKDSFSFQYKLSYSDGTTFFREVPSLDELRQLHRQLLKLANHMERFGASINRIVK